MDNEAKAYWIYLILNMLFILQLRTMTVQEN